MTFLYHFVQGNRNSITECSKGYRMIVSLASSYNVDSADQMYDTSSLTTSRDSNAGEGHTPAAIKRRLVQWSEHDYGGLEADQSRLLPR